MDDGSTIYLEWVCSEGSAKAYAARFSNDGGRITGTNPFVPRPEESDLYSDPQFDPLVIVGTVLAAGLIIRYVRELVLDLTGREVAIIDLSGETMQVRVVPIGRASQVIVKGADGSQTRFVPSDIDKIEQHITALLQG